MQTTTFKKILPLILIIAVLATGIFGVFDVKIAFALGRGTGGTGPGTQTSTSNRVILGPGPDGRAVGSKTDIINPRLNRIETAGAPGSGTYNNRAGTMTGTGLADGKKFEKEQERIRLEREEAARKSDSGTGCNIFWDFNLYNCIRSISANVVEIVLEFFGFIVGISGSILNVAVEKTVLKMGDGVKKIGAVEKGWEVFRDLSNIVIIFALLVVGMATILRIESYGIKKLLATLVAVALLINFSLFFTSVVIDSSNLLALQFYNKIVKSSQAHKKGSLITGWSGLSDSYMQALGLSTLYSKKDFSDLARTNLNFMQIFLVGVFGSVLFLVASFSFLAGAFLLISRYVVLIFLMILSPLAFVGMILPATSSYTKMWMNTLFKYALFAPIYLLLTWFVIEVINSETFRKSIGVFNDEKDKFVNLTDHTTFIETIPLVLNFIIVIFFIIASLIIAQQMGIKGSATVMKLGKSARQWGQGVLGKGALYAPRRVGRYAQLQAGAVAEKLQEGKGGFAKTLRKIPGVVGVAGMFGAAGRAIVDKREELQKDQSTDSLKNKLDMITTSVADKRAISKILFSREQGDPEKQAKIFNKMSTEQKKDAFKELSAKNRAAIMPYISTIDMGVVMKGLSTEEQDKTKDADTEFKVKGINERIKNAQIGNPKATQALKDTFGKKVSLDIKEKLYKKMSERGRIDLNSILNDPALKSELNNALSSEDMDKTEKMEIEIADKKIIEKVKKDLASAISSSAPAAIKLIMDNIQSKHIKDINPADMSNPLVAMHISNGDILNEIHKTGAYTKAQKETIKAKVNQNNPFWKTEAGKLWGA